MTNDHVRPFCLQTSAACNLWMALCFREVRRKVNQRFTEDGTVRYHEYKAYHFDQDASGDLTEDDQITMVNAPLMVSQIMSQND